MGELAKPQIICHAEHSTDMTLFDCRWVPSSARFVVAGTALSGTGILRVYQVRPNCYCNSFGPHNSPTYDEYQTQ